MRLELGQVECVSAQGLGRLGTLSTHHHIISSGTCSRRKPTHHVEDLLQFLIGVVDAELLKTVDLKGLEPGRRG